MCVYVCVYVCVCVCVCVCVGVCVCVSVCVYVWVGIRAVTNNQCMIEVEILLQANSTNSRIICN